MDSLVGLNLDLWNLITSPGRRVRIGLNYGTPSCEYKKPHVHVCVCTHVCTLRGTVTRTLSVCTCATAGSHTIVSPHTWFNDYSHHH